MAAIGSRRMTPIELQTRDLFIALKNLREHPHTRPSMLVYLQTIALSGATPRIRRAALGHLHRFYKDEAEARRA
jgi:hypothetical protein